MTAPQATVKTLAAALAPIPPDAPVVVDAGGTRLGAGFHLTEIARARIDSLDCGGRRLTYTEAAIQMLDSGTGRPMSAGTLTGILAKATAALPDLADLPLSIDANTGNAGLRRYHLAAVAPVDGAALLTLAPAQAQCRPVADALAAGLGDCRAVGCCA